MCYGECAELAAKTVRIDYQGQPEGLIVEIVNVVIMRERLLQMFGMTEVPENFVMDREIYTPRHHLAEAMRILCEPDRCILIDYYAKIYLIAFHMQLAVAQLLPGYKDDPNYQVCLRIAHRDMQLQIKHEVEMAKETS
jgi:hypothetical protein